MNNIKSYKLFLITEGNMEMLIAHGLPNGKLETYKEYLWVEKTGNFGDGVSKEKKLPPIKVQFNSMINDEWGNFTFSETKNGHKQGEKQKIEIHSIYPLDLQVDGFNNPINYKSKFEN